MKSSYSSSSAHADLTAAQKADADAASNVSMCRLKPTALKHRAYVDAFLTEDKPLSLKPLGMKPRALKRCTAK